jgi:transcription elongation factor GreA
MIMISESKANNTPNLGYCATQFLITLSTDERITYQQEINKFVLWFNEGRPINEITIVEVANYSEQTSSPTKLEPIKLFLRHLHTKGLVQDKLYLHIKAKKATYKKDASRSKVQKQNGKSSIPPIELTQEGYNKLQQELGKLKEERPLIIEEIRKAAADKDFKENAPLSAAREQMSRSESRIQELEETLKRATIMDFNAPKKKHIGIGDTVVVCDMATNEHITYMLVDAREAKPGSGKISVASPIGKALSGHGKGDQVSVNAPVGTIDYRIEDIKHS